MITGHWDYRDKLPELVRICGISSGVALPVPTAAPVTATMQAAMQSQMNATRESVSQQVAASKEQLKQRVGAATGAVTTQIHATRESMDRQVASSKEKLQQGVGAASGAFKMHVERASASVSSLPAPAFALPSMPAVKWTGVDTTNLTPKPSTPNPLCLACRGQAQRVRAQMPWPREYAHCQCRHGGRKGRRGMAACHASCARAHPCHYVEGPLGFSIPFNPFYPYNKQYQH